MSTLNSYAEKKQAPRGVAIHKYRRKNGTIVINKIDRYAFWRGNKKSIMSDILEAQAKEIDRYLKDCVTFQLLINER